MDWIFAIDGAVASLLAGGLSFLLLALLFIPLERAFPKKPGQRVMRPEWWTDFAFMFGNYLLWGSATLACLQAVEGVFNAAASPSFRALVASQPYVLQGLEAFVLGDIALYWTHRLQHTYDFLWRFHAVHHTSEHLDWLAAHREHPLDNLLTQTMINVPAFALGIPVGTLSALVMLRGLWAIYIHSNARLPLGPLHLLLGSPATHHWHHAKQRTAYNFANLSPLIDMLFGTYYRPDHDPEVIGIAEPFPRSYLGQLGHPFRRRKPSA